jgi:hypothetical protein
VGLILLAVALVVGATLVIGNATGRKQEANKAGAPTQLVAGGAEDATSPSTKSLFE